MNSDSKIMNDNLIYLNEWIKYNDSLKKLHIIGPNLICEMDGREESIDISDYYLPDILYNENLRQDLRDGTKIDAEDLFRIIRVNVLANDLHVLEQQKTSTPISIICSFKTLADEQGKEYIVLQDNQGQRYKLTQHVSDIQKIYQDLSAQNENVSMEAFKQRLEGIRK